MKNVQFVLDEAAMLSKMDAINDALGIGRAYGIRFQFYYQSIGQLQTCFPNGQDRTFFSNTSSVFFAVNDSATAEHVSNLIGEHTIIVDSGGSSRSSTSQWSGGMHPSTGGSNSTTTNQNWAQQPRKLLKSEEIIALPPRMAITFTPGVPPIRTWLLRYYEERNFTGRSRGLASQCAEVAMFAGTVMWCLLLLGFAMWLTHALIHGRTCSRFQ